MKNCLKRVTALVLATIFILACATGCSKKKEESTIALSSSVKSIMWDTSSLETLVSLSGLTWDEHVKAEQIELGGAFKGMTLKTIERVNDTQLKISAEGELTDNESSGFISFATDAIIGNSALNEEEQASQEVVDFPYGVSIDVLRPRMEVSVENIDGKEATIILSLTDCAFQDTLKPEYFTVVGEGQTLSVASVKKTDATVCKLTFSGNKETVFATLKNASISIAAKAMNFGRKLESEFDVFDASLSSMVDYVEDWENDFLATVILSLSNGTFADFDASSVTSDGELDKIVSVEKQDNSHMIVKILVKKENATLETLGFDGTLSIKGLWCRNLWGENKEDITLDVHYNASDSNKELIAVETELAYDLLKAGIKSIASAIGSEAGSRLMEAIDSDLFGDKTVQQLDQLNTYLQQMDTKWTTSLGRINNHLAIMEDKIGQNNCSRALDDFDTMADRLRSTVLHLENKKAAVDNAVEGTPEYEKAKADFIAAVEKEHCKVYSETHLLGKKIASGSSGLAHGIVGTYDEMLSLIYNFDVQTYDLKEDFRVFVLSLYMNAYDQSVLYYQLTDPNNYLLKDLEQQMIEISALIESMNVTRRTDDNAYCYAAGKTLRLQCASISGNSIVGRGGIDDTAAEKMIKRAEYRGTTLGADLDASGFHFDNRMTDRTFTECTKTLVVNYQAFEKRSSTKNEWWRTITSVNVNTHEVKKNVKIYYQLQERNWFESLFDFPYEQIECWGVYEFRGMELLVA